MSIFQASQALYPSASSLRERYKSHGETAAKHQPSQLTSNKTNPMRFSTLAALFLAGVVANAASLRKDPPQHTEIPKGPTQIVDDKHQMLDLLFGPGQQRSTVQTMTPKGGEKAQQWMVVQDANDKSVYTIQNLGQPDFLSFVNVGVTDAKFGINSQLCGSGAPMQWHIRRTPRGNGYNFIDPRSGLAARSWTPRDGASNTVSEGAPATMESLNHHEEAFIFHFRPVKNCA
ncbi:hypothetical protein MKEN_00234500 [Mycena kentingensis (nom. inval.)]|nr:hypothetical protein MKEN_00234500 [Mycena kentingensis (nom. inval.)]